MTRISQLQGPHVLTFSVPAEATAGNADTWSLGVLPFDATVTKVEIVPDAAVTANGTDYFSLALKNGSTSIATRAWSATNSVANTKESMTLSSTAADLNVSAGSVLTLARTKTGSTGLASPRFAVVVTVQIR